MKFVVVVPSVRKGDRPKTIMSMEVPNDSLARAKILKPIMKDVRNYAIKYGIVGYFVIGKDKQYQEFAIAINSRTVINLAITGNKERWAVWKGAYQLEQIPKSDSRVMKALTIANDKFGW